MKIPQVELARPGDHFLLLIPNYWARAETLEKAKAGIRKASGFNAEKGEWVLWSVDPNACCDDVCGDIIHKHDHKPIKLATSAK